MGKNVQLKKLIDNEIVDIMPKTVAENVAVGSNNLSDLIPNEASDTNQLADKTYVDAKFASIPDPDLTNCVMKDSSIDDAGLEFTNTEGMSVGVVSTLQDIANKVDEGRFDDFIDSYNLRNNQLDAIIANKEDKKTIDFTFTLSEDLVDDLGANVYVPSIELSDLPIPEEADYSEGYCNFTGVGICSYECWSGSMLYLRSTSPSGVVTEYIFETRGGITDNNILTFSKVGQASSSLKDKQGALHIDFTFYGRSESGVEVGPTMFNTDNNGIRKGHCYTAFLDNTTINGNYGNLRYANYTMGYNAVSPFIYDNTEYTNYLLVDALSMNDNTVHVLLFSYDENDDTWTFVADITWGDDFASNASMVDLVTNVDLTNKTVTKDKCIASDSVWNSSTAWDYLVLDANDAQVSPNIAIKDIYNDAWLMDNLATLIESMYSDIQVINAQISSMATTDDIYALQDTIDGLQDQINALQSAASNHLTKEVVNELPTTNIDTNKIYIKPKN